MQKAPDHKLKSDVDGWTAFERAVDAAVKSGPKPKLEPEKPKKEKSAQKQATSSSLGGKS